MSRPLTGLNILVTRPAPKAKELGEMLKKQGASAFCWPSIEIHALNWANLQTESLLLSVEILIFISPHAVEHFFSSLSAKNIQRLQYKTLIGVGPGTAIKLRDKGYSNILQPKGKAQTESVIAIPQLQAISAKKIVIVRGGGGRELLFDTLRARGAEVTYVEVYERACPKRDISPLISSWQAKSFDIVLITSLEGLKNLVFLLGHQYQHLLGESTVSAINENMLISLQELGVRDIMHIDSANNEALVEAINRYYNSLTNGQYRVGSTDEQNS